MKIYCGHMCINFLTGYNIVPNIHNHVNCDTSKLQNFVDTVEILNIKNIQDVRKVLNKKCELIYVEL